MSKNDVSNCVLMAGYLDRIGAGKVLLDRGPLSFDWTPPLLVGRERELESLASMFMGIGNENVSGRAVVVGHVGTGKTVLTRRFGEDVVREMDGIRKIVLSHVNCRNHPSTSQVLQQIALSLDSRHPERGFSSGEIILKKYEKKVTINSYEGYVRQLIGWREFMRGIYQNYDEKMQKSNFFTHKNKMKKNWYEGTTGLDPLDHAIKNAKNYAWSHHIERLMILSNIMNLCEISPKQVYDWFMEMYMDSSDWVMSPNVYGMGLFSDGGIFATKPYICGSAYFLKMMDFKKGPWCLIMDGLYWRFIDKNKKFFLKNPRLSMMVRILEKMKPDRKKEIFSAANSFIKSNTI